MKDATERQAENDKVTGKVGAHVGGAEGCGHCLAHSLPALIRGQRQDCLVLVGPRKLHPALPHISARCFHGLPGGVYNVPVFLIDKRIGGQAWDQHLIAGQTARE